MTGTHISPPSNSCGATSHRGNRSASILLLFALATALALAPRAAIAWNCGDETLSNAGKYCSATTEASFCACESDARSDFFVARGICTNEPETADRNECFADAGDTRSEDEDFCEEKRAWRLDACAVLGEGRYDPAFEPSQFDKNFAQLTHPNPYYPIKAGYRWEYESESETDVVEVLNRTKLIDGVTCIVVRDLVSEDGKLKEGTDDWIAHAKTGDVWYCGEEAKDYEVFDGDKPKAPELVSIEGSFKADRDGADPGILFLASPTKGKAYIEEFSLANAEDMARILTTTYSYGKSSTLDAGVPPDLATYLCSAGNCIVTENISLIEPEIVEHKYYAKGIGTFLETGPDNEVVRLVDCNFDARCGGLPQP